MTPPKEKEPKKPKAPRKSTVKVSKKPRVVLEPIGEQTAPASDPSRSVPIDIAADSQQTATSPSYDIIRVRAYELYLARGGTHGQDLEDWLAAERELMPKI